MISGYVLFNKKKATSLDNNCGGSFAARERWCRERESNPYRGYPPRDFKSLASASFAIPARFRRFVITLKFAANSLPAGTCSILLRGQFLIAAIVICAFASKDSALEGDCVPSIMIVESGAGTVHV